VTEAEWLAATDSRPMSVFLRRATSDRKMRLFACACCRGVWAAFTWLAATIRPKQISVGRLTLGRH
jgi:hypothetical protein